MKRKVIDVCFVNPGADFDVGKREFIHYLDTASVCKNRIETIQCLRRGYPSRAQRTIREKDILISSVRPNLEHNCFVRSVCENMVASTGFIHVRVNDCNSVVPEFLYYYLTCPQRVAAYSKIAETSQSSYPSFNKDVIEDVCLPAYDFPSQREIGKFLSSIDRLIELSRKRIENLEKLAKEIYDYWFVQFDFPDKNGKPYKTSGGKMIYNAVLKREIPEGWEVKKFGDLICISEGQVNPQKMGDQLLEHYSIPAYDDSRYPVMENASSILSNKFKVTIETFLVSKLNPQFKRLWDPVCVTDDAVCSTEFIVCRSKDELNKPFNYGVADSEAFQLYMRQRSSSSTGSRKRLDPKDILDFKLAMPLDDGLLDKFNKLAGNCLAMIKESRKGIHELTQLREFLLPLLMNGQAKMR